MSIGTVAYQAFPSIGYVMSISQNGSISQGGRMSMPVSPSSYIYSQFRHVSGVPAPEGVQGVTISKLAIIDSLIEQISRMDRQPHLLFGNEDLSDESRVNALIEQYHSQVRNMQTANAGNPYATSTPLLGAVFNISV